MNATRLADLRSPARLLPAVYALVDEPVIGVLLTGSVATGACDDQSDLDVYALTRTGTPWRTYFRWAEMDVDVDLWVVSEPYLRRALETKSPIVFGMARGEILSDTGGTLARLIDEACIRYSAGPRPRTPHQIMQLRHRIHTELEDLARLAADAPPEDVAQYAHVVLLSLLKAHCALERLWALDDRYILDDLRRRSPRIAALATRVIRAGSSAERVAEVRNLASAILAPVGGTLRYFTAPLADERRKRGPQQGRRRLASVAE
jgi:hypothetical protein